MSRWKVSGRETLHTWKTSKLTGPLRAVWEADSPASPFLFPAGLFRAGKILPDGVPKGLLFVRCFVYMRGKG